MVSVSQVVAYGSHLDANPATVRTLGKSEGIQRPASLPAQL